MERWRTVYRSGNKRVLLRDRGGGSRRRGGGGDCGGDLVTAAGWAVTVFLILAVVVAYWPWFLAAGLLYGGYACWGKWK